MLDPKVTDVLHPFLASTLGMEANKRAESVAAGYPAIMKQLENGSGGATDVSGAVFSLQQVTTPVVDDGEALAENLTEESKNISFAPGDLHNQAAFLLAETRASVQAAGDGGIETDRSPAQTKQPPAVGKR